MGKHLLFLLSSLPGHQGLREGWRGRTKAWRAEAGWDIREKSFNIKVVRPWHRLPTQIGDSSPQELFKARLDGAWNNLGK